MFCLVVAVLCGCETAAWERCKRSPGFPDTCLPILSRFRADSLGQPFNDSFHLGSRRLRSTHCVNSGFVGTFTFSITHS